MVFTSEICDADITNCSDVNCQFSIQRQNNMWIISVSRQMANPNLLVPSMAEPPITFTEYNQGDPMSFLFQIKSESYSIKVNGVSLSQEFSLTGSDPEVSRPNLKSPNVEQEHMAKVLKKLKTIKDHKTLKNTRKH